MTGRNLACPNQLFELQGYRQRAVPLEPNGPALTPIDADPAAHAQLWIELSGLSADGDGLERAGIHAGPASDAQTFLDPAAVPGGGQHGSPGPVGIHGPAAAGTTVADGVKAPQHGVFEEGMVDMAPAMFRLEDRRRLFGGNPAAAAGMMFRYKGSEGFSHDQADIQGKAGVGADGAAGTLQGDEVIGLPQDQVSGKSIRNDALEVIQAYVLSHPDQTLRRLQRHHLAVIAVGKRGLSSRLFLAPAIPVLGIDAQDAEEENTQRLQDSRQRMIPGTDADVEIGPPPVHISVQEIQERITRDFFTFPD